MKLSIALIICPSSFYPSLLDLRRKVGTICTNYAIMPRTVYVPYYLFNDFGGASGQASRNYLPRPFRQAGYYLK